MPRLARFRLGAVGPHDPDDDAVGGDVQQAGWSGHVWAT